MTFRILSSLLFLLPLLAQGAGDSPRVDFAYRDASSDARAPSRLVQLQGTRQQDGFRFLDACGSNGLGCECIFSRTKWDRNPVKASVVGVHAQANAVSCQIPFSISDRELLGAGPANPIFVRVKARKGKTLDDKLAIRTTLSLADVLGTQLAQTKVRGIFRYDCGRLFFEGEGVNVNSISCVPYQRLGVIQARYNFYTFRSGEDVNHPGGDSTFPSDICGRNNFLKTQCTGSAPELRYGFYKEFKEPFVVGISMTRAPEGDNLTDLYGYAALPDSAGSCPAGLVKARPWTAQPASITEGSLGDNPPSSFVNASNSLNNTVVETEAPENFTVSRRASSQPCSASGDCNGATFEQPEQVQSVGYTALTPVVCVIPTSLMSDLF